MSCVIHDKDLLGNSVEVIDEFPFFSFLLGDLHPHVLGLPFVLLAIALAVNLVAWAKEEGRWKKEDVGVPDGAPEAIPDEVTGVPSGALGIVSGGVQLEGDGRMAGARTAVARFWSCLGEATGLGGAGVVLYALALGALGFLNTWDFPIYVGLATLALGAAHVWREGWSGAAVGRALLGGVAFAVLGWLFYLPFYIGFQSQLGGVLPEPA